MSSEKSRGLISHSRHVAGNIYMLIAGMPQNEVYEIFGLNFAVQRAIANGFAPNMSVRTLGRLAKTADIGISELFLDTNNPGDYTAWYAESDTQYFVDNISARLADLGWSMARLSREIGISEGTMRNYFRGETLPRLETLQAIADTMDVEVADLFLPPEGSAE